jgi:hypothetical protein
VCSRRPTKRLLTHRAALPSGRNNSLGTQSMLQDLAQQSRPLGFGASPPFKTHSPQCTARRARGFHQTSLSKVPRR